MKHLTRLMDLTEKEIHDILNTADQLKYEVQHDIPHPRLQGKTLGMIFEKVSTRTACPLKRACTSWAGMHCSSPPGTCRCLSLIHI